MKIWKLKFHGFLSKFKTQSIHDVPMVPLNNKKKIHWIPWNRSAPISITRAVPWNSMEFHGTQSNFHTPGCTQPMLHSVMDPGTKRKLCRSRFRVMQGTQKHSDACWSSLPFILYKLQKRKQAVKCMICRVYRSEKKIWLPPEYFESNIALNQ